MSIANELMESWDMDRPGVDVLEWAYNYLQTENYITDNSNENGFSKNLLDKYQIKSKLISNHKFNEKKNLSKIINILKKGLVVSMISDAGTPNISDPGSLLVKECVKNEIEIIPLPGPSAVTTALSASGFLDKFFFYGFFPEKNNEILKILETTKKIEGSIIFFISAKKINKIKLSALLLIMLLYTRTEKNIYS